MRLADLYLKIQKGCLCLIVGIGVFANAEMGKPAIQPANDAMGLNPVAKDNTRLLGNSSNAAR